VVLIKDKVIVVAGIWLAMCIFPVSIAAPAAIDASAVITQSIGIPARVVIPAAHIDAPITALGKDQYGYMQAPSDTVTVGWYKYGARPGEKGNAVLDGHLDSETYPGVFYAIQKLRIGDRIGIGDDTGESRTFEVFDIKVYDAYNFPMRDILGPTESKNLHLITCYGEFDKFRHAYVERLVVSARLVIE
jgi:LPXTG-site transpeptidase (sortase) family protein